MADRTDLLPARRRAPILNHVRLRGAASIQELAGRNRRVAVTNGLDAALLCRDAPMIDTLVVGGRLRAGSSVLSGEPGLEFLGRLHADICLLGAHAISGKVVTETSLDGAAVKRAMLRGARRTILLADSSNFHHAAFCTMCDVADLDEVITDDGIDRAVMSGLRTCGVTVSIVAPEKTDRASAHLA